MTPKAELKHQLRLQSPAGLTGQEDTLLKWHVHTAGKSVLASPRVRKEQVGSDNDFLASLRRHTSSRPLDSVRCSDQPWSEVEEVYRRSPTSGGEDHGGAVWEAGHHT